LPGDRIALMLPIRLIACTLLGSTTARLERMRHRAAA
jgi:hypothetical protein